MKREMTNPKKRKKKTTMQFPHALSLTLHLIAFCLYISIYTLIGQKHKIGS